MRSARWLGWGLVMVGMALSGSAQDDEEGALLAQLNAHRDTAPACWDGSDWRDWPPGARPLQRSPALSQAARDHNEAMIETDCFDHTCPGEAPLEQRVARAGYPPTWRVLAENLAAGVETAREAFEIWRSSLSHNRAMLLCQARAVGLARTFAADSAMGWYWTVDFSDVVDTEPEDAPLTLAQQLDADRDGRLGDEEILVAVQYWVLALPVPGTGGALVDDVRIFTLIALWVQGAPL